jgi:hypothetical protein
VEDAPSGTNMYMREMASGGDPELRALHYVEIAIQ